MSPGNIRIDLKADLTGAERMIVNRFERQVPFATSQALNDAALDGQAAQRAYQRTFFDVKRAQFVDRSVKHKPRSTKKRLWTKVLIDPPGGRSRADITAKFETDRSKRPISGSSIAIPTEHVPRTAKGIVRKPWRPSNLKRKRVTVRKGRRAKIGQTFVMEGAIWQRQPDGGVLPLYWLRPSVPITPDLRFRENVARAASASYPSHFVRRFNAAVRTAR